VAGGSVSAHLHLHVVPRWGGDTNFMPVTADTKVLPETLDQTYRRLRPYFDAPPRPRTGEGAGGEGCPLKQLRSRERSP
jgi:hypothetical protein